MQDFVVGCIWNYPTAFVFQGLNEQQNWETLVTYSGSQLSTRGQMFDFPINNQNNQFPKFYSDFQLTVNTIAGAGGWTGISRFEMIGYFSDGFTTEQMSKVYYYAIIYHILNCD